MLPGDLPLTLLCHPATPAPVVRTIEAGATRRADGTLSFRYCLRGDIVRLLIPTPDPAGRTDGLWEHTCFEAFVGLAGQTAYTEFNFSPSGQWATYAFADYRQPAAEPEVFAPPQITARVFAGRIEIEAVVPPGTLDLSASEARLQIGLCAVVEARDLIDGRHSYWALRHAADRPDFHDRRGFVLELAAPRRTPGGD
ncbi:MAG TPA: DOMON-like domain-containing protein [Accumulibacter sp.]|uniref:DOMON-like domain-containing protein n=1 Tax=Accumulibacter sp. TaxID=2053492 RepID=UPI002879E82C|nr:DOMON-like domain-containing protein [Accumulibacter sp.]MDS4055173.1 DOMON-like domain-containing protein [Accumulibacter sp.]HMV06250.1 DOMON-like domain-containing protein [Accumulibacter sp.]HMW78986.1 DOMON-like domain-containing protein [Accumulibacter sp.]HMX69194.1 DOMON-like domain-containing protein [Accumulibacter sp.]HNC25554.1 DOMON-like domain-containing protein [Accumulibacter sp.]